MGHFRSQVIYIYTYIYILEISLKFMDLATVVFKLSVA